MDFSCSEWRARERMMAPNLIGFQGHENLTSFHGY